MTTTKLAAAGATVVASIIGRDDLFKALTPAQRNALRVAAYGDDAGKKIFVLKLHIS